MHLVTTSVVESPPKSRLSKSKDIVLKKKIFITPIWIYLAVFQLSESVLVFIRLSKK